MESDRAQTARLHRGVAISMRARSDEREMGRNMFTGTSQQHGERPPGAGHDRPVTAGSPQGHGGR